MGVEQGIVDLLSNGLKIPECGISGNAELLDTCPPHPTAVGRYRELHRHRRPPAKSDHR